MPAVMGTGSSFRLRGNFWLFGAIFFLYLFSTSRERPWGDATPVWEVADSIANAHNLHAKTRWPSALQNGKDGHLYGIAPVLQSAVHVPGAYLQHKVATIFPTYWQIAWRFTAHLAPTVLGALTCVLFFGLCRRLEMAPVAAAATTLALAFASSVWVYARYPYSEALQLFFFTGFFAKLLQVRREPTARQAALLGLWAGLLVNAKPVFLVSTLGAGLFLVWELRRNWRALLLVAAVTTASAAPLGFIYLFYNYLRWGSFLQTGYGVSVGTSGLATGAAGVRPIPLVGLWGMFLSPGKSIFLYSPPLFVALFAFHRFAKRFPYIVLAMVLTIVPNLYIHAQTLSWSGDYAWGPRYTVFALAILLLPAGFLVEQWLRTPTLLRRSVKMATLAGVFLSGAFVTYLGNAIYWDHFIRIDNEARQAWLGVPNNKGDGMSTAASQCSTCFETIYSLHWLPPFQHILGNYWLFSHVPDKDDWVKAEKDAPWRRYTSLQLNIKDSYGRARIDWWFVEYRNAFPVLAWFLVILLPAISALMLLLFFLEVRLGYTGRTTPDLSTAPQQASILPGTHAELERG
jgi:hypothetical protein